MYQTNSGLESMVNYSSLSSRNYSSKPSISYSKLEMEAAPELIPQEYSAEIVNLDKPIEVLRQTINYDNSKKDYLQNKGKYLSGGYSSSTYTKKFIPKTVEKFNPNSFLSDKRPPTQFIGEANEIKDLISQAFMKTTGLYFPSDIVVRVCTPETMKIFNRDWDKSITGFCFNRKGFGMSEIFVLQGELDRVMLTVGHEIGHCLSKQLENPRDEEAKAFAFSLAWAEKIKEHNIGDLAMNINLRPAKNGVHDVALAFVLDTMEKGERALDIYRKLVINKLSMEGANELCISS